MRKLCECGCKKPVSLATITSKKRGWIKGKPLRFIHGHHRRFKGSIQEKFERYFRKVPNSCWAWEGYKNYKGYGIFPLKNSGAHRVAFELYCGPIPKGHYVCHKCDNPACVNPEHLFVGTPKDNSHDMVKKNRQSRGETNGFVKLTEKEVLAIRSDPRTQQEIAFDYGVARTLISRIKNRKIWYHI